MKINVNLDSNIYLIDREVYEKIAGMISDIIKKPIDIMFTGGIINAGMKIENDKFIVYLPKFSPLYRNDLDLYRAFEHELSHILFGTTEEMVEKVAKSVSNIPLDIVRVVVNIVEDHRVDSHWNAIYPGSKKIREDFLKTIPDRFKIKPNNPINVLQLVRFGRHEKILYESEDNNLIILADRFSRLLKKVELAPPESTVIVSIAILNLMVKYLEHKKVEQDHGYQTTLCQYKSYPKEDKKGGRYHIRIPSVEELEKRKLSEIIEETRVLSYRLREELKNFVFSHHDIDIRGKRGVELRVDDNKLSNLLERLQEKGKEMNAHIKNKLLEIHTKSRQMYKPKYIVNTSLELPLSEKIIRDADKATSTRISKLLCRIGKREKITHSEEGVEIDIEEFIERIHDPNKNDIFVDSDTERKTNISILLDISGSMDNRKTDMACRALLTLWEATDMIRQTDLDVYVFYESEDGILKIRDVTKDEMRRIRHGLGYTPTDKALDYVARNLRKDGKNIIILITDGLPETKLDKSKYKSLEEMLSDMAEKTRATINHIRKQGIDIFTFIVNPRYDNTTLRGIFGPEDTWIKLDNFDKLPDTLYRFVLQKIVRNS